MRGAWFSVAFGLLAFACGGAGERRRPRPSLIVERAPQAAAQGEAHWVYHPPSGAVARARLRLKSGATLAVGEGGERWLTREGARPEPSPFAAPEALIDVGLREQSYAFVGESGAVYLADEPLGPFRSLRPPPDAFVEVASRGGHLAAVRGDGTLWSGSDWGASWARARAPELRVASLALSKSGRGLALAVPESYLETNDDGLSWHPASLPTRGARRLTADAAGELLVEGLFGRERLVGNRWETSAAPKGPELLAVDLGRAPDGGAVEERSAALDAGRYFALERAGAAGQRKWTLLSGALGGRLATRAVSELDVCRELVLSARGGRLAVICAEVRAVKSSGVLRYFTSPDGGETWHARKLVLRGVLGEVRMALDDEGALLVTGLCPPHLTAVGCAARGLYRIEASVDRQQPAALPGLALPRAVLFGRGGRAYAAGPRDKDQSLALYVSTDGGRTFQPRDVAASLRTDPGEVREAALTLNVGADGSLSLVRRSARRMELVSLDPDGRVLESGEPPGGTRHVAAAGLHALAVAPETRSVWESLDGGGTWELVPLPRPLCAPAVSAGGKSSCEIAMACEAAGCVLGNSLSRIGWGSSTQGAALSLPRAAPEPFAARKYKTPIACTLGAEPWQLVSGMTEAPRAADAALGATVWFGLGADLESGAVWSVHALEGKSALTRRELFSAVAEPTRYALEVSNQIEGGVALRYRVPQSSRHETQIQNVEVAWDNRFVDLIGHGRLDGAFDPVPGDYGSRAPRTLSAETALLSVAGPGVYLRLHRARGDRQPTYYFEGRAVRELPAVDWPDRVLSAGRTEMMNLDGVDQPILFVDGGARLGLAVRKANGYALGAFTLGHPNPAAAGLAQVVGIAYAGKKPGFFVIEARPSGTWWHAYFVAVAGGGPEGPRFAPAEPVALQADLPDPPAPCSAPVRGGKPRIVSAAFPGSPHPVLISDASEPPRVLVTERAVVHGSPKEPCAAAFDAGAVRPLGVPQMSRNFRGIERLEPRISAIIPLHDMAHAWAFQEARQSEWQTAVQARPMSCRFDPSLTIPRESLPRLGSPNEGDASRATTGEE